MLEPPDSSATSFVAPNAGMDADPAGSLRVLERLVEAGDVFVLTGAGISTDSGIPDYRGPDGVNKATPMLYQEFLRSRGARRRYWARAFAGWERFHGVVPNRGHFAVAALQRHGHINALITQNVDGLHQQAGATNVTELHGTLSRVVCLDCDATDHRDAVQHRMRCDNPGAEDGVVREVRPDGDVILDDHAIHRFVAPICVACGGDRIKPDVVFFGGAVPRSRVEACYQALDEARGCLVLGSSLAVMSGYRFVRRAAERKIPVAVVTRGWCRGEPETTLRIDDDLSRTLGELCRRLGYQIS